MKKVLLNDNWIMNYGGREYCSNIPCSVVKNLKSGNAIPDPYYGDNEKKVQQIFDNDYSFSKEFNLEKKDLECREIFLTFEMLDTVCDIYLNGELLSSEKNMFRKFSYPVKEKLRDGKNIIKIDFHSPVKYINDHPANLGKPYNVIRKAGCSFGWDWGIRLPDSGIYGNVYLEILNGGKLEDLYVRQEHNGGKVKLKIAAEAQISGNLKSVIKIYDFNNELLFVKTADAAGCNRAEFTLENPSLWMPREYGDQPLYRVTAELTDGGITEDIKERKIGLRTVRIDNSRDGDGYRFGFIINGVKVYFKGENLIIPDAIIPDVNEKTWKGFVDNAVKSNLNGIRVWGGAYYPDDIFYEMCDEKGIMVFQDFMFACTFYYPSKGMMENIEKELDYQIKRLRSHPSIVLWCGNNELDCIFTTMTSKEERTVALRKLFKAGNGFDFKTKLIIRYMYSKIFLRLIPRKLRELSYGIPFIHSTPHGHRPLGVKSMFDYIKEGDMHYYLQYDGNAPYRIMHSDEFVCRFMAEMGFQSYPSIKTIKSFAGEESRSPYSDVMYSHQKCNRGNETIELYMDRDYIVPDSFEDYVYLSQVQAAEIMRYSVEFQRQHNSYNRGMIMWQMNDCWPVVSWSGIDYYGRWKAQQYLTRRFYSDLLISVDDKNGSAQIHVTKDTPGVAEGTVKWKLISGDKVINEGDEKYSVSSGDVMVREIECSGGKESTYLACSSPYGYFVHLFVEPKNFKFEKPAVNLECSENENEYIITLESDKMAKDVMVDFRSMDRILSDNFFDLIPGEKKIINLPKDGCSMASLEELKSEIFIKTLNDIMLGEKRK